MADLKLEVGKTYKTRAGETVKIVSYDSNELPYAYIAESEDSYMEDGLYLKGNTASRDLIKESTPPNQGARTKKPATESNNMSYILEPEFAKALKRIEALEAQLAATKPQEEPKGAFWPTVGLDEYYILSDNGTVRGPVAHDGDDHDELYFAMGHAFRTRKEAENARGYRKALTKLAGLTKGFVPNWSDAQQRKWYPYWCLKFKWQCSSTNTARHSQLPHFASVSALEAASLGALRY